MKNPLFPIVYALLLSPAICLASANGVIINEVAWMGTMASANDEWIELYNPTDADINLSGWRLVSADGKLAILLKGFIISKGLYVMERTDETTLPQIPADLIYTGALANTGQPLTLSDRSGVGVDQVPSPGRWPAGDNNTKQTMERSENGWHTSKDAGGTPKAPNSEGVSKPVDTTLSTAKKTDTTYLSALSEPLMENGTNPWWLFLAALGITAVCAGAIVFVKFKLSKNHVRT